MKRHKLFYVSALSMMLVCSSACNDGMVGHDAPPEADAPAVCDANTLELTSDEMTILRTMDGSSPKISQDEAISIAAKFLDKNQLSKSTSGVRCDVVTRKNPSISKTGTDESDTLMYVLNYGNNDGYALVCADIRVPEQILAYSETGSMDTETDNPGVQLFMDMAEDYMDASIAEIESKRDSLEEVIQGKFAETSEYQGTHLSKSRYAINYNTFQYYQTTESEITEKCEPLLRTFWHQRSPYNDYVPECKVDSCNKKHHFPAGCEAIAISQLMVYWKWPLFVDGVSMNWSSMNFSNRDLENKARNNNANYKNQVATLCNYVGKSVNTKYGCQSSSAQTNDAKVFLRNCGYSTSEVLNYDEKKALQSLKNKRPLLIRGDCSRIYNTTKHEYEYCGGHIWLLDGYVVETTSCTRYNMHIVTYQEDNGSTSTEVYYTTNQSNTDAYYFHSNWGWDGNDNGYFRSDVFNTQNRYMINTLCDKMQGNSNYVNDHNYEYNIEIINNIYR